MAAQTTAAPAPPAALPAPPSIHTRPLVTGGGIWARVGFAFQDHTAAGFCLDMLADGSKLKAVWCEGQDDITLIWDGIGQDEVEFVQVKSDDPGRFWSTAILCERDARVKKENRLGTSILEKSLACDRNFCEPRRFRLVTATPANGELQPLTYPLDSPARDKGDTKVQGLYKEAEDRVKDFKSERGNDFNFWLDNALVDVRHCEESVRAANILALTKWVEKQAVWLLQDQIESLYTYLLHRVQEAAKCDPLTTPDDKKLLRGRLLTWLLEEARKIEHPGVTQAGERLRQKLQAAGIADSDIQAAAELRRYFRTEQLNPKYVGRDDQQRIEREVGVRPLALRSRLDAGTIPDNGVQFHATCVTEMEGLPAALGLQHPPDVSFLLGCMYNITDRCVHRFRGLVMMSASRLAGKPAGLPVLADDVLEFHAARLLLLLKHAGIGNRIDGLTKLAKLDFFVRYPQFFEAVSRKLGKQVQAPKRDVESSMVRFHYGPWDKRYYHVLSYLEAKGLLAVDGDDGKYVFRLTDSGREAANALDASGNFTDLTAQMKAVKDVLGKRAGSTLKNLIYKTFDEEVAALSLDEVIG